MKLMKRVWAALLLLAASGQLYADEGMWVLKELNKQNLARMAELGFTPSYDQFGRRLDLYEPPLWFRFYPAIEQRGT